MRCRRHGLCQPQNTVELWVLLMLVEESRHLARELPQCHIISCPACQIKGAATACIILTESTHAVKTCTFTA